MRLVELRHTLPNLKALLLTLSSPIPPPPLPLNSGSSTYLDSRASSRQTSRAWSIPPNQDSPSSSTAGRASPDLTSPWKKPGTVRRSMLSRTSMGHPVPSAREYEEDVKKDPEKADNEEREIDLSRSIISSPA